MTLRGTGRMVLVALAIAACSGEPSAAQVAVQIGAAAPGYCEAGGGAAVIDVPIVMIVDATGALDVQNPVASVPGVICNAAAVLSVASSGLEPQSQRGTLVSALQVGYSAEVQFSDATVRVAAAKASQAHAQTTGPAKGRLTILLTPLQPQFDLPAGIVFTGTLHIRLAPL